MLGRYSKKKKGLDIDVYCINSEVDRKKHLHMLMIDHDSKDFSETLSIAADHLEYGDAWIYETGNGYHIYFTSKFVTLEELLDVYKYDMRLEQEWAQMTKQRGYGTLRCSAYPDNSIRFKAHIKSNIKPEEISSFLATFIRIVIEQYGSQIISSEVVDNGT